MISAATQRELRPTAITDITARARRVFNLVDGVPRAFEADGQTVRYGKDGITAIFDNSVAGPTETCNHDPR